LWENNSRINWTGNIQIRTPDRDEFADYGVKNGSTTFPIESDGDYEFKISGSGFEETTERVEVKTGFNLGSNTLYMVLGLGLLAVVLVIWKVFSGGGGGSSEGESLKVDLE